MTPEKKVQNGIIRYLKECQLKGDNVFYERRQAGGASYKQGICDLYIVYQGLHIEVEVKQSKGNLSTMQEKWRDKCHKLNIPWTCCYDLEDFINFFNNLKENIKNVIQW